MLSTTTLTKTYGMGPSEFQALKGINLEIKQGESVAIIGKSGSGKSTLMHLLAGLDSPTSGSINLSEQDLHSLSEGALAKLRNEEFGFIFQQFFLQANLSVLENVALPLKIRGVGKKERNAVALQMLKAVSLDDKASKTARSLSGGQKQRAAIARALIGEPKVIFADEPTGNLDTENGEAVMKLLFKLQKEKGITLIIVTHDQDVADRCDRTVTIKDGKLVSPR